jgi:hypothetical protein
MTAAMELRQPWKEQWPQNFQSPENLDDDRGRVMERGKSRGKNPSPSPQGGKGASPLATTMVDGTKIIRLDDKEVLQNILSGTNA